MKPFMRVPLRGFIDEELKVRGWTLLELAIKSGLGGGIIFDLYCNDLPVNEKIAAGLSQAFGQSKEYWLRLGRG